MEQKHNSEQNADVTTSSSHNAKPHVSCRFPIDFFEFAFLVEACIPPRPIARAMFWDSVIDKHYHNMTPDERKHLYEWIKKNWAFEEGVKKGDEDCLLFEARFNPANQWKITTQYKGEIQEHDCFKWKGRYQVSKSTSIQDDYVIGAVPNGS